MTTFEVIAHCALLSSVSTGTILDQLIADHGIKEMLTRGKVHAMALRRELLKDLEPTEHPHSRITLRVKNPYSRTH